MFICLVICIRISFTFMLNRISFKFVNLPFTAFIHQWTHGFFPSHHCHSFCQHIWTNVSESFSVFGHMPRSKIVRMLDRCNYTFEKIIVFHSDCCAYNHIPQLKFLSLTHILHLILKLWYIFAEVYYHFWFYLQSYPQFFIFSTFSFIPTIYILFWNNIRK